jgi:pilus assembly protein CpaF
MTPAMVERRQLHPDHEPLVEEVCRRATEIAGDVRDVVAAAARGVAPLLDRDAQQLIADAAVARLAGLGPLAALLDDPSVDEVLVNRGHEVWVDRGGVLERAGDLAGQRVEHLAERILAPIGRRLDRTSPIVDARLADGSRVCAVIEPLAVDGPALSIRRFAQRVRPLSDFVDEAGANRCREIVDAGCNIVVSGPTSSGKTSLLASLVALVSERERLLLLEDTSELPARHPHLVRLESRPATADLPRPIQLDDLVRTALRLRPDRLIIGEVRGGEALALVQAINTGHDGSLTTCHANSATDALLRLESLVLQAAPTWPLTAIREQLRRSIDVVIHVRRDTLSGRRRIETVAEVDPERSTDSGAPRLRALHAAGDDATPVVPLRRGRRDVA